jgi:Effector Associated Constant Component 1
MPNPKVELTVNAPTHAQSGKMAIELKSWLNQHVGHFAYEIKKDDPTTQDLGAILVVLGTAAGPVVSAFLEETARELAKSVAAWMRKRQLTVTVDSGGGVKVEGADPDTAERLIFEILKRQQNDKT